MATYADAEISLSSDSLNRLETILDSKFGYRMTSIKYEHRTKWILVLSLKDFKKAQYRAN